MHDHFRVLGLELDASHDHVKKAFRTLAKKWHPDKNRSPGAEDRFKEIKAAYDFLQSSDRRDVHAADLRRHRARETTEQHQHEGRHEHHSHHHHHHHDHRPHQSHGHGHHHYGHGHHQHGHGHHQNQERQQQQPDAAHNADGRSTTAPPPQQQHHHDQHHGRHHKQEHHHHHHHHHTHHGAQENAGSRGGDWHTGGGSAGKKRTHYRFDRAARSPNAFERDSGGFGQRRAKMDNTSSFSSRAGHTSPTFEFTFDFTSFDPLIEDILNLRKMFNFAATAAAGAAPTSPRPGSAQKKAKKVDPFGNPLPDSVDPGIYDWSAPRAFSQNWADLGDPEFFCHYCGRVMAITLLRRHEPKCAKLGGARRTEFLDPQNFSDHETVINRTRQKMAQRSQQQHHGKAGEKFVTCEQCGLGLDEQSAQTHRAQCMHQSHTHPSPRPPPHQQPATSTSEERRGRSGGGGGGPSGSGWNSPRRHAHRRSASAHPHSRTPWNNNFSEDKVSDTPKSTGQSEDSGHERKEAEPHHHHQHSHHHHQTNQQPSKKTETPISSKGCEKCVARFGRHAGFFCSCSVSHLL